MTSGSERRLYARKPLRTRGFLAEKGSTALEVQTIDLSVGGMCIVTPNQLMVGNEYIISVDLLSNGKNRRVAATIEVAYSLGNSKDGFKSGLRFVDIDDASAAVVEEWMKE